METQKATEIIRALADRRDPAMRLCPRDTATRAGEQFPPGSPYQLATAELLGEDGPRSVCGATAMIPQYRCGFQRTMAVFDRCMECTYRMQVQMQT